MSAHPLDVAAAQLEYQSKMIDELVRFATAHRTPLPRHAPYLRRFTLPAAAETPPPATPCKAIVLVRPDLYLTPAAEAAVIAWEMQGMPHG